MENKQAPQFETITIEGWFCVHDKEFPDLTRAILDKKLFKYSAKSYRIKNLYLPKIERIVGSFFNPTYVQAVIDIKGSLIPFFIERRKVKKLQEIIDSVKDQTNLSL